MNDKITSVCSYLRFGKVHHENTSYFAGVIRKSKEVLSKLK